MKSPAGRTRSAPRRQVRLDLRRATPPPPPDDELLDRRTKSFWKWFAVVALFHFVLLVGVMFFYRSEVTPPVTPEISLMPDGDVVKGTPGAQAAPKVGASTAAPSHSHPHPKAAHPRAVKPPVPAPQPMPTPPPVVTPPVPDETKPVIRDDNAPTVMAVKPKPVKIAPVKPKIKVKVDLTPVEEAAPTKTEIKKVKPLPPLVDEQPDDQTPEKETANPDSTGLSKEEVAAKLGKKLGDEGIHNATKTGAYGAAGGHDNPFKDYYNSISEQIMEKWQVPNQADAQATDPVVQIHVEKDGRVPAGSVTLLRSSRNAAIDDSALSAARSIGYTLQPLPDGCPPDISITLNLSH